MATKTRIKNISQDPLTLPLPLKGVLVAGGDVVTGISKATLLELFNTHPYGAEFIELTSLPPSTPVTPGLEGPVDMGGSTFTNLTAPVNNTDVATKAYVDTSGGGGGGGITQLTGDVDTGAPAAGSVAATVVALQGNAVSATAPALDQVLSWSGSDWAPITLAPGGVTDVTASAPMASSGGATPDISLTPGTSAGDVLTWGGAAWAGAAPAVTGITELAGDVIAGPGTGLQNATVAGIEGIPVDATAPTPGQVLGYDGTWWTPTTLPADTGITEITGDVLVGPGSGSQAATVVKLQGRSISTTAPTANQILQWISGTSEWTPTANGVGLGSKVLLVVEGGAYATIQAAIDAATDNDMILVGPKASGASWGPAAFSPGKRLIVASLGSKWSTQVKVDSITFNVNSGLNILLNTVFVRGLFINGSFTAAAPGVNFYGASPGRLRLQECYIYNSNAATGTGVVSNNSGSGSSLYVDNCIVQSGAGTGVGLDHQQGYTIVRADSEISKYQYPVQCAAGTVEIYDAILDGTGVANEVIRVTGGLVTVAYSTIRNTTTNASGVNLVNAGANFAMSDASFTIATGTGYCVNGPAAATPTAVFLYGNISYTNTLAAAYNVKVKNTITALAITQAFTSSP